MSVRTSRALVSVLLLAIVGSGLSIWGSGPSAAGGTRGTNILVVGIDRRADMTKEEIRRLHVGGKGCDCTDVMMLVHLSADRRRASVVSIPRDSYAQFADHTAHPRHFGKINGAFAEGGGELAVRTVEQVTGLRIDHYLQTDFSGFVSTVDRLGGATVCTANPVQDKNSGLNLRAGTHRTDGNRTLRYARARHLSPPGDLGRVRRQQRVLVGMLSRLKSEGALGDPLGTLRTARELMKSVTTDKDTSLADLVALGTSLGRLSPQQTELMTVPIAEFDHRVPGIGSTLLWDADRSTALWAALREDRPITGDTRIQPVGGVPVATAPSTVSVRVTNGEVAEALRGNGFAVEQVPAAASPEQTTITYDPTQEPAALALAAALPGARLAPVPGHGTSADVDVAAGSTAAKVVKVTLDRSAVEGAPVTADELSCPQ